MPTLNISLPDSMRDHIEQQAERGHYTTSEYLRHLIREDQKRVSAAERLLLADYLALSAKQLDDGDVVALTADDVLAKGRNQRARSAS